MVSVRAASELYDIRDLMMVFVRMMAEVFNVNDFDLFFFEPAVECGWVKK